MRNEAVRFLEGSLVQQQLNPFPRALLSFAMLFSAPLFPAALFRQPISPFQLFNQIIIHRPGL
jgi:hypothetical protein